MKPIKLFVYCVCARTYTRSLVKQNHWETAKHVLIFYIFLLECVHAHTPVRYQGKIRLLYIYYLCFSRDTRAFVVFLRERKQAKQYFFFHTVIVQKSFVYQIEPADFLFRGCLISQKYNCNSMLTNHFILNNNSCRNFVNVFLAQIK